MATIKPSYGTESDITPSGLQSLANGTAVASAAQTNATALAEDYVVSVVIAGTAASNASCQVYVYTSQDNTNFDTLASATLLGNVYLTATPQQATFSLVGAGNFYQCPEYFEIVVYNNTGSLLSGSGNAIKITPINTTIS